MGIGDSAADVMAMARLLDSAWRLERAFPGEMADVFGEFLDRLSVVSGVSRAKLDAMSTDEVHGVMRRVCLGDGYADAVEVAREAWDSGQT